MSVAAGTRLGSNELGAQVGAGGMGEVYQAHDTKLGRDPILEAPVALTARDLWACLSFPLFAREV